MKVSKRIMSISIMHRNKQVYIPMKFIMGLQYVWAENLMHKSTDWFSTYTISLYPDLIKPIQLPYNVYPLGHPLIPRLNRVR